jgi:hypothetical protein
MLKFHPVSKVPNLGKFGGFLVYKVHVNKKNLKQKKTEKIDGVSMRFLVQNRSF